MIKKISSVLVFSIFTAFVSFADNAEIKFLKGNIQDKIASVRESEKQVSSIVAVKGLDFVLENIDLLKDDRDLAGLAVASVYAYPVEEYINNAELTLLKFNTIFYGFVDKNVKTSILDKMDILFKSAPKQEITLFLNDFISDSLSNKKACDEIDLKAVEVLKNTGNGKTFDIIYSAVKNDTFKQNRELFVSVLVSLAGRSTKEIISIVEKADYTELEFIYSILINNPNLNQTLKAEFAEYLLNKSMIIIRDSSEISKDLSLFQLKTARILFENNWTRSAALMVSYFPIAKSEYQAGFITEKEFTQIINYVEKLASKDSVKLFANYLGELNTEMENGHLMAEEVISAVISALGALGDKSAFDCLLYSTYLNYPEKIVTQARNALSSLKW